MRRLGIISSSVLLLLPVGLSPAGGTGSVAAGGGGWDVTVVDPGQSFRGLDAVNRRVAWVSGGSTTGGAGAVYRTTDAAAVVHTHSPRAVAASTVLDELPAVHYSILRAARGPTIRVAPYERFGSDELARAAVAGLEGRTAVLLQNHGAITYGRDLAEAYERAQLVEWLADVHLAASGFGSPRILTAEELGQVASESARRRYGAATTAAGAATEGAR